MRGARRLIREGICLYRFLRPNNRPWRVLVFYAEHAVYYQYFQALIDELHGEPIGYITSDEHDPILQQPGDQVRAFYFRILLPFVLLFLDAKALVMTMTDLHRFHIRRSIRGAHHVYVFHAMVSTHMVYAKGAFDHYDTIFCVGPHHLAELRRAEGLDRTPKKRLLQVGYPPLDALYAEHQALRDRAAVGTERRGLILLAPSWGAENILETCGHQVVEVLTAAGYEVVVRPHPEFIKRRPDMIRGLDEFCASRHGVRLELGGRVTRSIHAADVLITDWSGIALEYAFATERPVLFIDVPPKVRNPEHGRWGMPPIEMDLRSQIGIVLTPEAVGEIDRMVSRLLAERARFRERIRTCRAKSVYHFGSSAAVGAAYLRDLCAGGDGSGQAAREPEAVADVAPQGAGQLR